MGENLNDKLQLSLRGDGTTELIPIKADNLAEATYKSIIACHDLAARIETPKHTPGGSLGYDAIMAIEVKNPDSEPKIYQPGMQESPRGVVQYILEVTHGIHNHWKKDKEHPTLWGYTYNERFLDQIPVVLQRIKADWDEKMDQWGKGIGRISGRDYQFAIWRAGEDIILEQEDPPCFQLGQLKFQLNSQGEIVMNYITTWRSRDLFIAWNENNIAQVELMKLLKNKVSDMLGVPIKLGKYTDISTSLHLYGMYIDKYKLENQINGFKKEGYNYESQSMYLEHYLYPEGIKGLKGMVHAQSLAERDGLGRQQPISLLKEKGYDLKYYPPEWDTWDPRWDAEPDITKLARVL